MVLSGFKAFKEVAHFPDVDALAALLVRKYEITAIMAEPYDGESIQVMSVVNLNNTRSTVTNEPTPRAIRWFASLNSRRDPPMFPETEEDSMRVVDPDTRVHPMLSKYQDKPDRLLDTFLLTQW